MRMNRRALPRPLLPCALSLLLFFTLLPLAGAAAPAPAPPAWIDEGEYVRFPDSGLYAAEHWEHILALRQYAAEGGREMELWSAPVSAHYQALANALWQDYALQYELRLICYQIAQNKGGQLTGAERNLLALPFPEGESAAALPPAARRQLHLWTARSNLQPFPFVAGSVEAQSFLDHCSSMKALFALPDFRSEEVYEHAFMALVAPETLRQYREMIFVLINGSYFASPYPAGAEGGAQRLEYARLMDERTMVPIRFLAEPLGLSVGWSQQTRTVTLGGGGLQIELPIESKTARVNGRAVPLDAPARIVGERSFVPLRFVSEQLGAEVHWDGAKRLVTVENPRGMTIANSNLNQWALPMGALINESNRSRGFSGLCFGLREGTPYRAGDRDAEQALWYTLPASMRASASTTARGILQSAWNVTTKAALAATVLQMTAYGHNDTFFESVAQIEALSEAQLQAHLQTASEVDAYMLPYTQALFAKWGLRGILCWDLFRMSNLVQWGYDAQYLTLEEALALLQPAALLLRQNFESWDEAVENFVDGYHWWARIDARGLPFTESEYGQRYLQLKARSPHLFDDALFQNDLLPVEGVDLSALMAQVQP